MTDSVGFSSVIMTVIAAMALQIMPFPNPIAAYLPDWILLVAIYWLINAPDKFSVGSAWIVGIFTDILTGHILGLHALSYSVVAYLCLKVHRRFDYFPLPQQAFILLFLLLLSRLLIHWSQNFILPHAVDLPYWASSLIGALAWPFVSLLLRSFRPRYQPYT